MELDEDSFPNRRNNPNFQTVPVQTPLLVHQQQLIGGKEKGKEKENANKRKRVDYDDEEEVTTLPAPQPDEDDMDVEEDEFRQHVSTMQMDPSRRVERFPGMSEPMLRVLQDNLETILDDELRRSIIQATNPYLEFADLLVASSKGKIRSDFIYSMSFFDEDIMVDKDGIRIPKNDMDFRNHTLNVMDDPNTLEMESDLHRLELEIKELDEDYILFQADWNKFFVDWLSTDAGLEMIDFFDKVKTRFEEKATRIYNTVSNWIQTKYTNLTKITVLGPMVRLAAWGLRFGGEGAKLVLNTLRKVVPLQSAALVQSHFSNLPLSSAASMNIGASINSSSTQEFHKPLMDYINHVFYATFNQLALQHLPGVSASIPFAERERATRLPDATLYHQASIQHLLNSNPIFQASMNSMPLGPKFTAEEQYSNLFNQISKDANKSKYEKSVDTITFWQPFQVILNSMSLAIKEFDKKRDGILKRVGFNQLPKNLLEALAKAENNKKETFDAFCKAKLEKNDKRDLLTAKNAEITTLNTNVTQLINDTREIYKIYLNDLRAIDNQLVIRPDLRINADLEGDKLFIPNLPNNAQFNLTQKYFDLIHLYDEYKTQKTKLSTLKTEQQELDKEITKMTTTITLFQAQAKTMSELITKNRLEFQKKRDEALINYDKMTSKSAIEAQTQALKTEYDIQTKKIKQALTDLYVQEYKLEYKQGKTSTSYIDIGERKKNRITNTPLSGTIAEDTFIKKQLAKNKLYTQQMSVMKDFFDAFIDNLIKNRLLANGFILAADKSTDLVNFNKNNLFIDLNQDPVKGVTMDYYKALWEAYHWAFKLLNFAETSFLTKNLESMDSLYAYFVQQDSALQPNEKEVEKRVYNDDLAAVKRDWQMNVAKKQKSLLYDPDADARYNYFMNFGKTVSSEVDLDISAVVFKPQVKGAIQIATDDLNLAIRNRYAKTPYNRAFEPNLLMFSPQINSRFASLTVYILEVCFFIFIQPYH